jgi:hypothetical protein
METSIFLGGGFLGSRLRSQLGFRQRPPSLALVSRASLDPVLPVNPPLRKNVGKMLVDIFTFFNNIV